MRKGKEMIKANKGYETSSRNTRTGGWGAATGVAAQWTGEWAEVGDDVAEYKNSAGTAQE